MSLENQVLISYFSRTHLFKGEALNGVGAAGRGGGGGGWVVWVLLVKFPCQRTVDMTVWFSYACSHSCIANVCKIS